MTEKPAMSQVLMPPSRFTADSMQRVADTIFLKKVVEAGDAMGITHLKVRVRDVIPEATLAEMSAAAVAEAAELLARPNVSLAEIDAATAPTPSPVPPEPK
jgi:hypothetical protein